MKKLLSAVLLGAVIAFPPAVFAGVDPMQQQLIKRAQESKQKLKAAEQAKGAERDQLLQDHMKTLRQMLSEMRTMKPARGMSAKEHDEWMNEHLKIMEGLLDQMQDQHRLMMQTMGK